MIALGELQLLLATTLPSVILFTTAMASMPVSATLTQPAFLPERGILIQTPSLWATSPHTRLTFTSKPITRALKFRPWKIPASGTTSPVQLLELFKPTSAASLWLTTSLEHTI